jgi:hypothetical protein
MPTMRSPAVKMTLRPRCLLMPTLRPAVLSGTLSVGFYPPTSKQLRPRHTAASLAMAAGADAKAVQQMLGPRP